MYYENFNPFLFRAIRQKYRSQDEFARVVGKSQALISYIVNGERKLETAEKRRWAELLDRPVEELFGETVEA